MPMTDYGTITLPDVSAGSTTYWDSGNDLPAGTYRISYVTGAYDTNADLPSAWVVFRNYVLTFLYNNTTALNPPQPGYIFPTQNDAQLFWLGWASPLFTHTAGKIGMVFNDVGYGDNANGNPNPTFRLLLIEATPEPDPEPEPAPEEPATCETIDCCDPSPFVTISDQTEPVSPPVNPDQPSTDNQVPLMTSNTTPSGVAFSGPSSWTQPNAYLAFDHDLSLGQIITNFNSGLWDAWPAYIGYQFTAGKTISSYKVFPLYFNGVTPKAVAAAPRDWFLEGSNDGVNYVPVDQRLGITGWTPDVGKTFTIAFPQPWIYYRLHVYAADETIPHAPAYANGLAGVNEIELYL